MEKTNVMRILDQRKIKYNAYEYPHEDGVCVAGDEVAARLGQNPDQVFKTLVLTDSKNHYFVCVIPVLKELDLKLAAKEFNVKSLDMIHVKDLLNITGYIRGGCSPIGMKKQVPTIIDGSALLYNTIIFSAGKIGYQVEVNPKDLSNIIKLKFSEISR